MIQLILDEKPESWAAPQQKGKFRFNPKDKQKKIAITKIKSQYNKEIITEYVLIDFFFYFEPPKSASKKNKKKMYDGEIYPTKSDCTNMQKFYEDCLKQTVILDDRLVIQTCATKLYGKKEHVLIRIHTLEEILARAIKGEKDAT